MSTKIWRVHNVDVWLLQMKKKKRNNNNEVISQKRASCSSFIFLLCSLTDECTENTHSCEALEEAVKGTWNGSNVTAEKTFETRVSFEWNDSSRCHSRTDK